MLGSSPISRFNQQPQYLAQIDASNPLARGLVFAATPYGDSIGKRIGTPYGTATVSAGLAGRNYSTTDMVSGVEYFAAPELYGITTDATVMSFVSVTGNAPYSGLVSVPYVANAWSSPYGSFGLQADGNGTALRFWGGNTAGGTTDVDGSTATGILTDGLMHVYAGAKDSVSGVLMRDGLIENAATLVAAGTPFNWNTKNPVNLMGRNRNATGEGTVGKNYLTLIWNRKLSNPELLAVQLAPWQLFKAPARKLWAVPNGVINTQVTPSSGAMTISGASPAIAQTANQSIVPGQGSVAFAGYAPSISQSAGTSVLPGLGSIAFTGYAPTVARSASQSTAPGSGAISFAGYAPSIAQTASQTVSPSASALSFTGYSPSISQAVNIAVSPSSGLISVAGYAPAVSRTVANVVAPLAGALSVTGYAPSIARTNSQSVVIQSESLLLSGFAPSVAQTAPVLVLKYRIIGLKQGYNMDTVHFK